MEEVKKLAKKKTKWRKWMVILLNTAFSVASLSVTMIFYFYHPRELRYFIDVRSANYPDDKVPTLHLNPVISNFGTRTEVILSSDIVAVCNPSIGEPLLCYGEAKGPFVLKAAEAIMIPLTLQIAPKLDGYLAWRNTLVLVAIQIYLIGPDGKNRTELLPIGYANWDPARASITYEVFRSTVDKSVELYGLPRIGVYARTVSAENPLSGSDVDEVDEVNKVHQTTGKPIASW